MQEGLSRCTTTRVAERAGMSVGSLYQYYPNRDALLASVWKSIWSASARQSKGRAVRQEGGLSPKWRQRWWERILAPAQRSRQIKALYSVAAERGRSRTGQADVRAVDHGDCGYAGQRSRWRFHGSVGHGCHCFDRNSRAGHRSA